MSKNQLLKPYNIDIGSLASSPGGWSRNLHFHKIVSHYAGVIFTILLPRYLADFKKDRDKAQDFIGEYKRSQKA